MWPFSLVVGGFEIQARLFIDACREAGLDASVMQLMNEEDRPDVIHYWGLDPSFLTTMVRAHKSRVLNVVTALLPPQPTGIDRLVFSAKRFVRRQAKTLRSIVSLIDALVVLSEEQKAIATRHYGFDKRIVVVIPHIVDDAFWRPHRKEVGRYIFCSGNICARKNQLVLARAAMEGSFPLVLAGGVIPGEEDYFREVLRVAESSPDITYLGKMAPASDSLIDAYLGAAGYALLSHMEQQPVSVLEAAALGLPIALLDRPYCNQALFSGTLRIAAASTVDINEAVGRLLQEPDRYKITRANLGAMHPKAVAAEASKLYLSLAT